MLSLIVAILFGLSITFFAFQNSVGVPVTFANYQLPGVPLYLVVVIATLAGILMAWFISAIEGVSNSMNMRRKDGIITNDRREITSLQERVHELEIENANLRTSDRGETVDRRTEIIEDHPTAQRPSLFERLFPSSNRRYTKHF